MATSKAKRLLFISIISLVCFSVFFGCASTKETTSPSQPAVAEGSSTAAEPEVLRVGVSTNAPPLIYRQNQEIVGLEAELAQKLGEFLGKSVRFVELKWDDQIPALLENRTDIIMSGMSVTKMRQVRIAFSKPYLRTGQMALIRKKDRSRFSQGYYSILAHAMFMRIGVVKGTTGETFVRQNFERARRIVSFSTSRKAVEDLGGGGLDMVVHDAPIILMLAAENEAKGLTPLPSLMTEEYLAWGIRKNDVGLLESANGFVETIKSDGSLQSIAKRWIPLMN
ncbi:MAG: transporter substrate-binding domain-containing protein [Deltaproteobacteria bacterium]|nr:MAG: transporter substrate-binding domain-containing protein [Deltaproteobacteria bacterium]